MTSDKDRELATLAEEVAAGKVTFDWDQAGKVDLPPVPEGDIMVTKSIRRAPELYLRIKTAADQRHMSVSGFIRQCVEAELAVLENDKPISYADAVRALAGLPPISAHHAA